MAVASWRRRLHKARTARLEPWVPASRWGRRADRRPVPKCRARRDLQQAGRHWAVSRRGGWAPRPRAEGRSTGRSSGNGAEDGPPISRPGSGSGPTGHWSAGNGAPSDAISQADNVVAASAGTAPVALARCASKMARWSAALVRNGHAEPGCRLDEVSHGVGAEDPHGGAGDRAGTPNSVRAVPSVSRTKLEPVAPRADLGRPRSASGCCFYSRRRPGGKAGSVGDGGASRRACLDDRDRHEPVRRLHAVRQHARSS